MNKQLYLVEPTDDQFNEWMILKHSIQGLASICQNRMVVDDDTIISHQVALDNFITRTKSLSTRTIDSFKPITEKEAVKLGLI